jgi:hypothetical protein
MTTCSSCANWHPDAKPRRPVQLRGSIVQAVDLAPDVQAGECRQQLHVVAYAPQNTPQGTVMHALTIGYLKTPAQFPACGMHAPIVQPGIAGVGNA